MNNQLTVWKWRKYLLINGPDNPTFKHVLLTLACFMNANGKSCFPSVDTLVDTSSLSRPTIIKYLKKAKADGWIKIKKHGLEGKAWNRNEYVAILPKAVKEINYQPDKAVNQLNHERGKAVKLFNEGGKTDTDKAVKEVNSNSTYNSTTNSRPPTQKQVEDYFREKGTMLKKDILLEAEKFINHYADQDWKKSNGKKITNWHRQAGTWQANYQQWNEDRIKNNHQNNSNNKFKAPMA